VTVFFPASPSRPRRAVYVITHDQGSTRRLVNQQLQPRNLSDFDIGTYSFGGFDGQKIRLEPVTGNKVVVDAFLFTCVGPRSSRPVVTPPPVTTPSTASTTTRLPNTGPTPPAVIANAVPLTDVSNPNNNNGQTCVPGQRFTLDEASAQVQKFGAWASKEMPNVAYLRNFMSTEGLPNLRALFRTSGLPRGKKNEREKEKRKKENKACIQKHGRLMNGGPPLGTQACTRSPSSTPCPAHALRKFWLSLFPSFSE
jgi:hypothetical protein